MRTKTILALGVVAALAIGCKGKGDETKPAAPAPSATASTPPPAATPEPPPPATPAKSGNMAHCPSSVTGAKTEIQDGKDSVTVTITATDPAAVSDIRARSKVLNEAASKAAAQEVKHTGSGEGGGAFGRCPVVMRNTTVTVAEVPSGAALTVKPSDPKEFDWLKRESRDRLEELAKPGAESAGQGKMAHCPSAVQGAKTTVKDTKDGVDVTVVSEKKDQAVEKEIRERSKSLVEAAKVDPASVHHTGAGAGGGTFGRCPVVVKDTVVTSKDVPGGVQFTVKSSAPTGLADLRKEAKERAANFMSSANAKK